MLNHVFCSEVDGKIDELVGDCSTLDEYISRLEKLHIDSSLTQFKEHGFQVLVEGIIQFRNLLEHYEVISTSDADLIVHGKGINLDGETCTVGVFYVKDENEQLTSNKHHLSTFFANSQSHFGVDASQVHTMYVFSNAESIHDRTKEQYIDGLELKHTIRQIMKAQIEKIINGNMGFWKFFKKELKVIAKPLVRKILRQHEIEAVEACKNVDRGMIIIPTGTGKSLVEAAVIEECLKNNTAPVCLIATPRIVLTYQLINTILEYLVSRGIEARYLNLNSGSFDEDAMKAVMIANGLIASDIPSTTSIDKLTEIYRDCYKQEMPLIIGATYQSAPKILTANLPIDLFIHDEAHNLVKGVGRFSNDVKKEVHDIEGKKEFFFTATQAFTASPEGLGMDNKELYGEILYTRSPKEMIEAGEIIPPYVHRVVVDEAKIRRKKNLPLENIDLNDTGIERNIEFAAAVVEEAFLEHKNKVEEYNKTDYKIGAKLLVVCKGEEALSGFFRSTVIGEFCNNNPHIKLFGISTASGAYIDGKHIKPQGSGFKDKFLVALKSLKDDEDAIVFHIDMIGEGIDVPGITGVMAFRDLGTIKSSQTLGRAMRLCTVDRQKLYSNEIKPMDWSKMSKPYAWVVIPSYSFAQADMDARMVKIARSIKEQLGYIPFENANGSSADGRLEQLQKDAHGLLGKSPEEIKIIHEIQEPYFLKTIDLFKEEMNSSNESWKKGKKFINRIAITVNRGQKANQTGKTTKRT